VGIVTWTNRSATAGRAVRLAAAAAGIFLFTTAFAGEKQRVMACRAAKYDWNLSGAPAQPRVSRVNSVVSLTNYNQSSPIYIRRIVVYDRNGTMLCDFSSAAALPAKAFDPPVDFDFTRPLEAFQALNISTGVVGCIPWDLFPSNDIKTLTMVVYWSFGQAKPGIPLNGAVLTFITEFAAPSAMTSRDTAPCEEIWAP